MIVDAVVLAGGRGSRLGGVAKAALVVEGRTLLDRTLDAAGSARSLVVVGDPAVVAAATGRSPAVTREEPAYAGPAAGIAAGLARLAATERDPADLTLVLACDMPGVAAAVDRLLDEVARAAEASTPGSTTDGPGDDGAVAVSPDGRVQHLVGLYRTSALTAAVRDAGDLTGLSVRALLAGLRPAHVVVDGAATADIDTWTDAAAWRAEETVQTAKTEETR